MKVIIVLSFEVPGPEDVASILHTINPPKLPFFTGEARIAVGRNATTVIEWLDDEEETRSGP